jgi:TonB family protein
MNRISATLAAILFTASFVSPAVAQDPKTPTQNSAPSSAATEKEQPKSEIDLALEELKKRGEGVLTLCGDKCKDSKNVTTGGVMNGHAIELVQPAYPAIARQAHASGQVIVLVIIDRGGKVMAAQIVNGHPLLRVAALSAAKASRFTPTLAEEKPVNVLGKIIYNFVAMR